jgi:hypothetical protein
MESSIEKNPEIKKEMPRKKEKKVNKRVKLSWEKEPSGIPSGWNMSRKIELGCKAAEISLVRTAKWTHRDYAVDDTLLPPT